jgi:enoyl-CoA hydratase/carnithine racemase
VRLEALSVSLRPGGAVCDLRLPPGPLTRRAADELTAACDDLVEQRDVRVVVLGGGGPDFCPGPADDLDPLDAQPGPAAALARLRPPVVAVVHGRCASVGLELALCADVRLAAPDARFGLDLSSGRLPCWGGTQRLPRAVGTARAAAMLLLGTELTAAEARAAGLVAEVADDVDAAAEAVVEALVGLGPLALELAKEAVHRGSELPLRDGLRLEGDLNHLLQSSADRAEGLAAFFAKRPPDFAGR